MMMIKLDAGRKEASLSTKGKGKEGEESSTKAKVLEVYGRAKTELDGTGNLISTTTAGTY